VARPRPSFEKRRKEQARLEKQAAKRARRHERRESDRVENGSSPEQPDLAPQRGSTHPDDEPGRG
jgi:hypothetical protein